MEGPASRRRLNRQGGTGKSRYPFYVSPFSLMSDVAGMAVQLAGSLEASAPALKIGSSTFAALRAPEPVVVNSLPKPPSEDVESQTVPPIAGGRGR
jgi:hypothetical protein